MTTRTTSPDVAPPALDPYLVDLAAEVRAMNPRAHGYEDAVKALGDLAGDQLSLLLGAPETLADTLPSGFTNVERLSHPAVLDGKQFEGRILPLDEPIKYEVAVWEYTTDGGTKVRVCDLRDKTARTLKGTGPGSEAEQARLDAAFLRDLKIFADSSGVTRNTVTTNPSVSYTKVPSTKLRAYWLTVQDESSTSAGVRTVARVGDCGDNRGSEATLYHRLFGQRL